MASTLLQHPSVAQLIQFASGQVDVPALEELAAHIETCAGCRQTLNSLPRDSFEGLVRSVAVAVVDLSGNVTEQIDSAESPRTPGAGPAALPERLGDYRIVHILGQGGMGTVYEAQDERLKRRVALKMMKPEVAARPEARERFLREAQSAAAIEHDHLVTIYQVGEADGTPYLAMPLLRGQSLDDRLKSGARFSVEQIVLLARQVAEGLAAAHERGLTHRDIKPANLWLETVPGKSAETFRVKILDFGLARLADDDTHLTGTGTIVGTPAFMAPEQARGEAIDGRADLFSLGCVLYRLCTGTMPFRGETTMALLLSLATDQPAAPHLVHPEIPEALSKLTMDLLAKNPADRPASARGVVQRLEACADDDTMVLPALRPTPQPAPAKVPPRRGVLWAVALAAGVLAILLAGVVFFWQTPDGVARIECDDPSIKIAFDEGELKVVGAYKEPLSLKPGKHGLKIQRGDFEFETDKLVVNRGDKVVLRIEATPGKVQIVQAGKGVIGEKDVPPVPPVVVKPSGDPDRRAAEWVLSLPGSAVHINDEQLQNIPSADKLPKEPFRLTRIWLKGNQNLGDNLANLSGCVHLKQVEMSNSSVNDSALIHFKGCTGLRDIRLNNTKVTGPGLAHLKSCKVLTILELGGISMTEQTIKTLKEFTLTRLGLWKTGVTAQQLEELRQALPRCKIEHDGGTIEP